MPIINDYDAEIFQAFEERFSKKDSSGKNVYQLTAESMFAREDLEDPKVAEEVGRVVINAIFHGSSAEVGDVIHIGAHAVRHNRAKKLDRAAADAILKATEEVLSEQRAKVRGVPTSQEAQYYAAESRAVSRFVTVTLSNDVAEKKMQAIKEDSKGRYDELASRLRDESDAQTRALIDELGADVLGAIGENRAAVEAVVKQQLMAGKTLDAMRADLSTLSGLLSAVAGKTGDIQKLLETYSAQSNVKLDRLLTNSERARKQLDTVTDYVNAKKAAELKAQAAAQREAEYRGIAGAANFVELVGAATGSAAVVKTARAAGHMVTVAANIEKFNAIKAAAGGAMSLAALGPLSAIGTAGLALIQLFGSKSGPDSTQLMLDGLRDVQRQIGELADMVARGFEGVYRRQAIILRTVQHGINRIVSEMQAGHARIERKLDWTATTVLREIERLRRVSDYANFQGIIRKLDTTLAEMERYPDEFGEDEPVPDAKLREVLPALATGIQSTSCDRLVNGALFWEVDRKGVTGIPRFQYEIGTGAELKTLASMLGYFHGLYQQFLQDTGRERPEPLSVPNVQLYLRAAAMYAKLRAQPKGFTYDPKKVVLKSVRAIGQNALRVIEQLRDPAFFTWLFEHQRSKVTALHEFLQHEFAGLANLDGLIADMVADYQPVAKIARGTGGVEGVEVDASVVFAALAHDKLQIPQEFLLAEKLGLGEIRVTFTGGRVPGKIKRTGNTLNGTPPCAQYDVHVEFFVSDDERYPLYRLQADFFTEGKHKRTFSAKHERDVNSELNSPNGMGGRYKRKNGMPIAEFLAENWAAAIKSSTAAVEDPAIAAHRAAVRAKPEMIRRVVAQHPDVLDAVVSQPTYQEKLSDVQSAYLLLRFCGLYVGLDDASLEALTAGPTLATLTGRVAGFAAAAAADPGLDVLEYVASLASIDTTQDIVMAALARSVTGDSDIEAMLMETVLQLVRQQNAETAEDWEVTAELEAALATILQSRPRPTSAAPVGSAAAWTVPGVGTVLSPLGVGRGAPPPVTPGGSGHVVAPGTQ